MALVVETGAGTAGAKSRYQRILDAIIVRARHRDEEPGTYYENHHIVPRAHGGDDSVENIVRLTGREHYLAHWMLYRIHGDDSMAYAWRAMSMNKGGRYTSIGYHYAKAEWARRMAKLNTGKKFSEETKRRLSEAKAGLSPWNKGVRTGKRISPERIAYNAKPKLCRLCSTALAYERRKFKYCSMSCVASDRATWCRLPKSTKANSGSFQKGQTFSDVTRARISEANRGKKRETVACPNCDKIGAIVLMKRWHFDNCKELRNAPCD